MGLESQKQSTTTRVLSFQWQARCLSFCNSRLSSFKMYKKDAKCTVLLPQVCQSFKAGDLVQDLLKLIYNCSQMLTCSGTEKTWEEQCKTIVPKGEQNEKQLKKKKALSTHYTHIIRSNLAVSQ